jgi:hypothetical protein
LILAGMRGEPIRFGDLFSQVWRFIRFFTLTLFILAFLLLGPGLAILLALTVHEKILANLITSESAWLRSIGLGFIPDSTTASGDTPFFVWIPLALLIGLFVLHGLTVVVKCFYTVLLAADRGMRLDEAYVESRKTISKYGFGKHAFLILCALV